MPAAVARPRGFRGANGSGSLNGIPFQWALQGGELARTMQGSSVSYQVEIDKDEMRLSGGDLKDWSFVVGE